MLVELDPTGIGREPSMVAPLPASTRQGRVQLLKLIQYTGGKSGVVQIVGIPRDLMDSFMAVWPVPSPQPVKILIELVGERLVPRLKFLGDEGFKDRRLGHDPG